MREIFENGLNSSMAKMFNVNRDYINQEIHRLSSGSDNIAKLRRNGTSDNGALQTFNLIEEQDYESIGISMSSTTVY